MSENRRWDTNGPADVTLHAPPQPIMVLRPTGETHRNHSGDTSGSVRITFSELKVNPVNQNKKQL